MRRFDGGESISQDFYGGDCYTHKPKSKQSKIQKTPEEDEEEFEYIKKKSKEIEAKKERKKASITEEEEESFEEEDRKLTYLEQQQMYFQTLIPQIPDYECGVYTPQISFPRPSRDNYIVYEQNIRMNIPWNQNFFQ